MQTGEVITIYPGDTPYPRRLMLGFTDAYEPPHTIVGESEYGHCTIITVYRPDIAVWNADFKTKKTSKAMKCYICKVGKTALGYTPLVFEKEGHLVVIRDVLRQVCDTCRHLYMGADVAIALQKKNAKSISCRNRHGYYALRGCVMPSLVSVLAKRD